MDLNRFDGDATVLATPWPLIGLGQLYWLHASATLDDGTQHVETLANAQAVNADQVSAGLRIRLSRGFLLRLENATQLTLQLKVAFAANAAEGEAIMFPASDVNVVQLALTLPAPNVTGVVDGRLDPADIPGEGVKITVAYTGIAVDQWVSAQWVGVTAALSQDFPAVRVTNANTPVEFVVAKAKVEASLFKAVSVVYKVARTQGAEAKTSEALPFDIATLRGRQEDFEGFDLGQVSEVKSGGLTIKSYYAGTMSVDEGCANWGLSGKYLKVDTTVDNHYSGFTFYFDRPATFVSLNSGDTGISSYFFLRMADGSTESGRYVRGHATFARLTSGITEMSIFTANWAYSFIDNIWWISDEG